VNDGLDVEERLRAPIVAAPVEEAGEAVAEVEPMQQAGLDERQVDEAIEVPALRVDAGVEPGLRRPAFRHVRVDRVELLVEAAKHGHPDVADVGEETDVLVEPYGVDGGNAGEVLADQR